MMPSPHASESGDRDLWAAAAILAVDPFGLRGAVLRGCFGSARAQWIDLLLTLLPDAMPLHRLPVHIPEDRLLGGLDIAATLYAGRPIVERGLLARANQGIILGHSAERLDATTTAHVVSALDQTSIVLERDGFSLRESSQFCFIALDEGRDPDECVPASLRERLGLLIDFSISTERSPAIPMRYTRADIQAARQRIESVAMADEAIEALCATALYLGITSLRACMLSVRAARAAAALARRDRVTADDAALAARLVLAPRATQIVETVDTSEGRKDGESQPDEIADTAQGASGEGDDSDLSGDADRPLAEVIIEAVRAAIPHGLLSDAAAISGQTMRTRTSGRSGAVLRSTLKGRATGTRRGDARGGARLAVIETLRAAIPWQRLRIATRSGDQPRIAIRREDFRIVVRKEHRATTTIFVVDASGSAALHRMGEAKGAVELLLARCYVRRDNVALIAFRGRSADLLLAPTRSLTRAKRSLADLPCGGATPLANGIEAAAALSDAVRRRGQTPLTVFLTDGRANISRSGESARGQAETDALAAARILRAAALDTVLVDTSPRPHPMAQRIAAEMGARYLLLPFANSLSLSNAVDAIASGRRRASM